eukprot:9689818-Heterocapsa_arctica.AAC.1
MRKLRILLHGQAARQTNDWVRAFTRCPTLASQLQARHIHWLQVLLISPSHHLPVLAATTGFRATSPQSCGLSPKSVPTSQATPWLRQWWNDLKRVVHLCPAACSALSDCG